VVVVCGCGMLRLGDDSHAVEALGCSAAEEGGRCGGRNSRRGAAKLGLSAIPMMEEREWGSWWPHGGKDGGGPVGVGAAAHAWSVTSMTRARRRRVAHGRGRGRERTERAGEAGEWGRLEVGPS
jgi:hypothetical protein